MSKWDFSITPKRFFLGLVFCFLMGILLSFLSFVYVTPSHKPIPPSTISSINRYDLAFTNIIKEEGGYVSNSSDPGGETKFGISKHSYPHVDIPKLTLENAKEIYKRDYWDKINGDLLPSDALAIEVLEEAVNMGVHVAVSFLQSGILVCGGKVKIDGVMGPETIRESLKIPGDVLLKCIQSQSLSYYLVLVKQNPVLRKFLQGWFNRVLT